MVAQMLADHGWNERSPMIWKSPGGHCYAVILPEGEVHHERRFIKAKSLAKWHWLRFIAQHKNH
jgi:hypothetical protein